MSKEIKVVYGDEVNLVGTAEQAKALVKSIVVAPTYRENGKIVSPRKLDEAEVGRTFKVSGVDPQGQKIEMRIEIVSVQVSGGVVYEGRVPKNIGVWLKKESAFLRNAVGEVQTMEVKAVRTRKGRVKHVRIVVNGQKQYNSHYPLDVVVELVKEVRRQFPACSLV